MSTGLWSPELCLRLPDWHSGDWHLSRHDEVKAFFEQDWSAAFPFGEWEVAVDGEMSDHGDQVFVVSRQQGRGASSGAGRGGGA